MRIKKISSMSSAIKMPKMGGFGSMGTHSLTDKSGFNPLKKRRGDTIKITKPYTSNFSVTKSMKKKTKQTY